MCLFPGHSSYPPAKASFPHMFNFSPSSFCRDADVEIQTDGFDDTAYGAIDSVHDPSMGWGGGGLFIRLFT